MQRNRIERRIYSAAGDDRVLFFVFSQFSGLLSSKLDLCKNKT